MTLDDKDEQDLDLNADADAPEDLAPEPADDLDGGEGDDLIDPADVGLGDSWGSEASDPGDVDPDIPTTKGCAFCGSEIHIAALRCPHCAGFLPIAEGTIFKQYFWFLFASLAMVIGCLLPWERSFLKFNLTGVDGIGGSFCFLFAAYGVIASVWNIYHRKMIVWPVMLAAVDGAVFGWQRVFQILGEVGTRLDHEMASGMWAHLSKFQLLQMKAKEYAASMGPGLYLVVLFSSLVLLSVVLSVFKGAKQDARRKAEEREARAASRASRRPS